MELYYTVVSSEGEYQSKPTLSLGGFRSSSPVPSGEFGKIFSNISVLSLERLLPEYICLILYNNELETQTNVKIWLNLISTSLCKFRLGIQKLNSKGMSEIIPTPNSKPLSVIFEESFSEADAFEIDEISFKEGIAIWIERVFDEDSIEYKNRVSCDELYKNKDSNLNKKEELSLIVKYGN